MNECIVKKNLVCNYPIFPQLVKRRARRASNPREVHTRFSRAESSVFRLESIQNCRSPHQTSKFRQFDETLGKELRLLFHLASQHLRLPGSIYWFSYYLYPDISLL